MEDESIFEALQRVGADSVAREYSEAMRDGWRTIDDLAALASSSRSTISRLVSSAVADGTWEIIKVKVPGGSKARAYREIERLNK